MSWSAVVVDKDDALRVVNLLFTESVTGETYADRFSVPMNAPSTWLADLVRDKITALTARAALATPIVLGVVTPSAAPAGAIVDATRDQWLKDFLTLKRMDVLIKHGILTTLDANYVAKLAAVKTSYLPAYIDYVNDQT